MNTGKGQGLRHLVIDCEAITDIDVTAAGVVSELREWVVGEGVTFSYSRVRHVLAQEFDHFGLSDGSQRFDSNRVALEALAVGAG